MVNGDTLLSLPMYKLKKTMLTVIDYKISRQLYIETVKAKLRKTGCMYECVYVCISIYVYTHMCVYM